MRIRSRPRTAAAIVEFALVLPILTALLLGMFEISHAIRAKESLSNAAQRACRMGSWAGTTNDDLLPEVSDVMAEAGFSGQVVTVLVNDAPGDVMTARKGDKISVRVSVPTAKVFWLATVFITAPTIESETVVMVRQG
jgi:Flp pilus assembly protein TadG